MPRSGRDTIIRHVDRANNMLDRALLHLMQIDGIYAGAKITDSEGNFIPVEIPPIKEGDIYQKQREFIAAMSQMIVQTQEFITQIKDF